MKTKMTKQEKLMAGVDKLMLDAIGDDEGVIAREIMGYLYSRGVAIVTYPPRGSDLTGCAIVQVDPLIKERKGGHKRSF